MQEKHKTLGCTLVVTQNHLITLREDFNSPLRKSLAETLNPKLEENVVTPQPKQEEDFNQYLPETGSLVSFYTL